MWQAAAAKALKYLANRANPLVHAALAEALAGQGAILSLHSSPLSLSLSPLLSLISSPHTPPKSLKHGCVAALSLCQWCCRRWVLRCYRWCRCRQCCCPALLVVVVLHLLLLLALLLQLQLMWLLLLRLPAAAPPAMCNLVGGGPPVDGTMKHARVRQQALWRGLPQKFPSGGTH